MFIELQKRPEYNCNSGVLRREDIAPVFNGKILKCNDLNIHIPLQGAWEYRFSLIYDDIEYNQSQDKFIHKESGETVNNVLRYYKKDGNFILETNYCNWTVKNKDYY